MSKSHVNDWTSESPTSAQLKEFFAQIDSGRITKDRLQIFLREKLSNLEKFIADWQTFYQDVFGWKFDFSELSIPEKKSGFDRLLILTPGITPQFLFNKCTELFPTWKYTDKNLDEIITSDRTAKNSSYAIWLRDRVEADEEMKNISANQIKSQNIVTITLEERLLLELKFYKETGKHLEIYGWTLCAGSRYDDGGVPGVVWYDGGLGVGCYDSGDQHDDLRARVAVV